MQLEKKHIESRRSNKDKSVFDIYYPLDSTANLPSLASNAILQQYIKVGDILGHIKQGQKILNKVISPINGTVINILSIQSNNIKQNKVHIFTIKLCQHFPREKTQNFLSQTNSPNKSILLTADNCVFCDEQLWFYFEKEEKQITYKQLIRDFQNFDVQDFQWKVILNQQFTKDTEIGGTYDENYRILNAGKVTYLYQFNQKKPNPNTVVLKYKNIVCKHQKIASGICLFCYADVKNLKSFNYQRYLFQFDLQNFNQDLILTGQAMEDQALEFKNQLIKQKKLLLVLDLDNTILHSISLKKVDQGMKDSIQDYFIIPPQQAPSSIFVEKTLVKLRPNFQYFLQKIINLFEIFIYTKGTRPYAEQICYAIRKKYNSILEKTKNFLPHRIISRDEDTNLLKKSLDYIIPKNRQIILILDDRRDVWNHSSLCIFTKPYIFFYYAEITADGKTKLQPVEWQKGGGTLEHKFNQTQQKCIKQIQHAESIGNETVVIQKLKQLQKQIQNEPKQQEKIVVCIQQQPVEIKQSKQLQQKQQLSKKIVPPEINSSLKSQNNLQKYALLKTTSHIPDQYLVTALFALKQAHTIYFQKIKQPDQETKKQGKFADLCYSFNQYKKNLLEHVTAFFIGTDYKKLNSYRRAIRLGLKIVENSSQNFDVVIRPNSLGSAQNSAELADRHSNQVTKKLKQLKQIRKKPIVSQSWIDVCYQFNCCVHHGYFQPDEPYARVIYANQAVLNKSIGQSTMDTALKIKQILKDNEDFEITQNFK